MARRQGLVFPHPGYELLIIGGLRWWPVGNGVFEEATPTAPTGRTLRTQEMRRT